MRLFRRTKKNGTKKSWWDWVKEIAPVLVACCALTALLFQLIDRSAESSNQEIEQIVSAYYDACLRQDLESLPAFYAFPMERYYDLLRPSKQEVMEEQRRYYARWPYQRLHLDKESMIVQALNNGRKRVSMVLDYQTKQRSGDSYKNFDLEVSMVLDAEHKITSIYEAKN